MADVPSQPTSSRIGDHAGKIVTQNPALLQLLRENTMDKKPVRRVYVSSPAFVSDDDDHFKFVSTEVDAFDDDQDRAVYAVSSTRRDSDFISGHPEPGSYSSTRLKQNPDRRYDDHDKQNHQYHGGKENQAQYVLKSRDGRQTSSQGSTVSKHPSVVHPIQSPLKPLNKDEEEDRRTLEEEDAYQNQLLSRLHYQKEHDDQVSIPKFPLNFADDDDERGLKDSLEYAHNGSHPQDSSEEEDSDERNHSPQPVEYKTGNHGAVGYHDSGKNKMNQGRSNSQGQQFTQYNQGSGGLGPKPETLSDEVQKQQHQLILSQQQQLQAVLSQQQQQNQMMMMLMMQQQNQQVPVNPMIVGGQVLSPSGGQAPAPHPISHTPVQSASINANTALPKQPEPQWLPRDANPQGSQGHPGMHNENETRGAMQDSYNNYYAGGNAEDSHPNSYMADESGLTSLEDTQDSEMDISYAGSPRQQLDYVEMNKQILKGPPKKSYGQLLSRKKDFEVLVPKPMPRKPSNKKPPLPNKDITPHSMPASASKPIAAEKSPVAKPTSAEHVWQMRSKTLAVQKNQKAASQSGNAKSRKTGALRRYQSESTVNDMQKAQQVPKPHYVPVSSKSGHAQQAYAEPISGEVVLDGSNSPVRHTIITEDGQRVSVDINLKVNSPPPQLAAAHGGYVREAAREASPTQMPLMPVQQRREQPPPQLRTQAFTQPPPSHIQNTYAQPQLQGNYRPPGQHQQHLNYPETVGAHHQQPFSVYQPQHGTYQPDHPQITHTHAGQSQMPDQYMVQYEDSYQDLHPLSPVSSPYKILPPIGSADTDQGRPIDRQKESRNQEAQQKPGYMDQLKKQQNRNIDYKVYTLKDYKNLKREIKLGGLGPQIDTETHKERKEKMQRQMEYAKEIQDRNRQVVKTRAIDNRSLQHGDTDLLDRRRVALEYSKNVPKPRVVERRPDQPPSSRGPASPAGDAGNSSYRATQRTNTTRGLALAQQNQHEVIDLQKLQERHEEERRKVALMHQT